MPPRACTDLQYTDTVLYRSVHTSIRFRARFHYDNNCSSDGFDPAFYLEEYMYIVVPDDCSDSLASQSQQMHQWRFTMELKKSAIDISGVWRGLVNVEEL